MYLLIVIWHTAYNNIDIYLTKIVHSKSKFKIVLNVGIPISVLKVLL